MDSQRERDTEGFEYEGERQTYCGTLEYMAPEMINQRMYDHSIDTWALGILLYELVHGQAPFPGKREQIAKGQHAMKIPFRKDLTS